MSGLSAPTASVARPPSPAWESRCPPIAPAHVPERPIASRSVLIASAPLVPQLQRPQPFLSCFFEEEGSAPGKNRTCDLGFRKALLYPTELRGRADFAAEAVTFGGGA